MSFALDCSQQAAVAVFFSSLISFGKNVPKSLSQLTAQIKKLQKEAEAIKAKELDGVIARIKEAIQRYGLTATDLGLTKSRARRSGPSPVVRPACACPSASPSGWPGCGGGGV